MKVLVTGAAGLLGTELSLLLRRAGHEVVGVDNGSRYALLGEEGTRLQDSNFVLLDKAGVDVRRRDVLQLDKELLGVTHVVHASAQVCHSRKNDRAGDNITNNILGTAELLELARTQALPFLFISSSKVYGEKADLIPSTSALDESCPLGDQTHLTFFGATKLAADLLAQMYARQHGMTVGVLRPGCFTGPRALAAEAQNWLPWLVHCVKLRQTFRIFGDGNQVRCLLDAEDLAQACLLWLEAPRSGVWNIGGGFARATSVSAAIARVSSKLGAAALVSFHSRRPGDIRRLVLDSGLFAQTYGWYPAATLDDIFEAALR